MSNMLSKSERKIVGLGLIISAGLIFGAVLNFITYNASPSAPYGFYLRAPKLFEPKYIAFCLKAVHADAPFYHLACSPDRPHQTRILKQIATVDPDQGYWVVSTHPQAIDSQVIGWITPDQVRGHWVPFFTWGTTQ